MSVNLVKEDFLRAILRQLREMKNCLPNGSPPEKRILTLTVNPDGTLRGVTFGPGGHNDFRKCLLENVKKWRCQATRDGLPAEVVITLLLGV